MLSNLLTSDLQNDQFRLRFIDGWMKVYQKTCRDRSAIEQAKELIPLSQMVQANLDILEDNTTYKDKLLPLVVDWFANDFFRWFEEPPCEKCGECLKYLSSHINQEKKNVERYACKAEGCDYFYDFIRHNEPAILLHTRTGRCGEWANCFLAILLALDYDARAVNDSTDHVWNEVWSESRDAWIHVDPCERAIDQPLLYEVGWKKKLVYCIAFSKYEVIDVTPRYCINFSDTKTRRTECNESWLRTYLNQLTDNNLLLAPSDSKHLVLQRRARDIEYLEKISQKPQDVSKANQLVGRCTGKLSWRMARGECSSLVEQNTLIVVKAKVEPTSDRSSEPMFELLYNCDRDTYESTTSEYHQRKGWSAITYLHENVDFKYERDWKTSYVARYESCPHDRVGRIVWKFDWNALNLNELDRVEIQLRGQEYPNTQIKISMKSYANLDDSMAINSLSLTLNELSILKFGEHINTNTKYLELIASLSGGIAEDSVAWQKPQLFRQVRNKDAREWKFSFKVFPK